MAFAFTLWQPGDHLIYYGDEIGLAGSGDPDNHRMMSFTLFLSANQSELLQRVQRIGQLRAAGREYELLSPSSPNAPTALRFPHKDQVLVNSLSRSGCHARLVAPSRALPSSVASRIGQESAAANGRQ